MKAVQMKGSSQAFCTVQIGNYTRAHCVLYDIFAAYILYSVTSLLCCYILLLCGQKEISPIYVSS